MPARLHRRVIAVQCEPAWEPHHVKWARLFREVTGGRCSEIARSSGGAIGERMLEALGSPQSEKPTPFERAAVLLRILRDSGCAQGWPRLLDALCCEMGGRFVRDEEPASGALDSRDAHGLMHRLADLVGAYLDCADGDITVQDVERFEREFHELDSALRLTRLKVQAAAPRNSDPGSARNAAGAIGGVKQC